MDETLGFNITINHLPQYYQGSSFEWAPVGVAGWILGLGKPISIYHSNMVRYSLSCLRNAALQSGVYARA